MRRTAPLVLFLSLVALGLTASADEMLELEGLHLVAWEDVPGGTSSFAGPVSAAILMAWHADNGYPRLLSDLNGDGRVDREDTIALSIEFADQMNARREVVWDPFVVDVVARYVAESYPDTFEMWIYDPSLPEEFLDHLGRRLDPADYPGIDIVLLEEPGRPAYVEHLEQRRPGVIGIGSEPEPNAFTVSRSARFVEELIGWPVDLVSTSRQAFGAAPVWDTLLRHRFDRWVFDWTDWTPFEIFIVLMPIREASGEPGSPGEPSDPGREPGDDPGFPEPGDPGQPGGDPGQPGPSGDPGDTPFFPPGSLQEGACCLPDGFCDTLTADLCMQRGGAFIAGQTCGSISCPPPAGGPCAEVEGDIVYMCYRYESDGSITLQVTYQLINHGPVDAHNLSALYLASLSDGTHSISGHVWEHGITVTANGGTYSHTEMWNGVASFQGTLEMYGGLWIQTPPPWTCFPIVDQDAVRTEKPAVRCDGSPPSGGDDDTTGGCCLPTGSCLQTTPVACDQRGGTFMGPSWSCDQGCPGGEPQPEPGPSPLPNLWVTDMSGCWSWSNDGQENVIATVSSIVHNGGQATASNVKALVMANGVSQTVTVGTLAAGAQKSVSATLNLGPYDTVAWPVQTSMTADPSNEIPEADETNNSTNSAFPQSSDCN